MNAVKDVVRYAISRRVSTLCKMSMGFHLRKQNVNRSIAQFSIHRRWIHGSSSGLFQRLPALPSTVPIELSRVMVPDDTNPLGNVHGGTILKMIEQAGNIVATRHCNKERGRENAVITVLARADHIDFLQPMYVGEVSQLQAAVTYTSSRSMEVTVDVWAENVLSGMRRHTNTATLWYVAVPPDVEDVTKLNSVPVPPLKGLSVEEQNSGQERYNKQKAERLASSTMKKAAINVCSYCAQGTVEEYTVAASQSSLANIVHPSDCIEKYVVGGTLMKMMDNTSGISAIRHCKTLTLTACIDAINFLEPVRNGEVMFFTAWPTFTSNRSIEVEVTCEAEGLQARRRQVANAFFTFVTLGDSIVPLRLRTVDEERRFKEGLERYVARKEQRQKLRV